MSIKPGDLCEVISGAFGVKGPNVGKKVTVLSLAGIHPEYGTAWRCSGSDLVSEFGGFQLTQADFAQDWLKKLPPETTPPVESKIEEHV
jgi:hypothetical protein